MLLCVGVLAWPPIAPLVVAVLTTGLLAMQMRRGREFVLLENAGVRPLVVLGGALLVAVLLEVALWSTLSATGIWTGPPEIS